MDTAGVVFRLCCFCWRRLLPKEGKGSSTRTRSQACRTGCYMIATTSKPRLPAKAFCVRGAELASHYVSVSAKALTNFGMEEPDDRLTEISAAYMALVEHGSGCADCQESD
jgi:hypothetical protein